MDPAGPGTAGHQDLSRRPGLRGGRPRLHHRRWTGAVRGHRDVALRQRGLAVSHQIPVAAVADQMGVVVEGE
ncbi:Uncharacterised protein [Mycobacteroides abscessus subsp. abscessus]|nr:Uncharacterised protein [Mycobacteroides abscessus subsp. abscessus]